MVQKKSISIDDNLNIFDLPSRTWRSGLGNQVLDLNTVHPHKIHHSLVSEQFLADLCRTVDL